jgi:hypothetical protein
VEVVAGRQGGGRECVRSFPDIIMAKRGMSCHSITSV